MPRTRPCAIRPPAARSLRKYRQHPTHRGYCMVLQVLRTTGQQQQRRALADRRVALGGVGQREGGDGGHEHRVRHAVRHMEVGADRPAHPVHLCQGVPETQMLLVGLVHAVGEQARDGARENSESTSVTDELENAMPACACFVSASASLAGRSVIMHTNGSRTVTDVTWQRHTCALLHPISRASAYDASCCTTVIR